ncbi:MAG: SRPBCC family protein [Pseudomonadales bacterium]
MVEVTVTRELNAEAEKVWAILGDFGNLFWVPGPEKVDVIGSGEGMIRRLHITGMEPFDEVLQSLDADQKTFTYAIPKNAVIPFDNYIADVTVSAGADNTSQVVWHCTLDNGDVPETDAKSMIEGSYTMMLDALASNVETS